VAHLVNKEKVSFVFKGQVMNQRITFGEYGVGNQDSIIMINEMNSESSAGSTMRERWARLTTADDEFNEMVKLAASLSSRSEFLRLRDLNRLRLETNPRKYRRIVSNLASDGVDRVSGHRSREQTVVPGPAVEPACDPLPQVWWSAMSEPRDI
jgi:hypothetical protein